MQVQIWDTSKCRMVRSMDGHGGRVGVLAWNDSMLSSGSRDATIVHRDTRSPQQVLARLHGHDQEVRPTVYPCSFPSGQTRARAPVWLEGREGT